MPDEMVIRHCAPTLASLKTGSIFVCSGESEQAIRASIRSLDQRLCGKGLRVIPLQFRQGRRGAGGGRIRPHVHRMRGRALGAALTA